MSIKRVWLYGRVAAEGVVLVSISDGQYINTIQAISTCFKA